MAACARTRRWAVARWRELVPPYNILLNDQNLYVAFARSTLTACSPMGEQSQVDSLTIFGLIAVTAMMTFYALEAKNTWFILAFAGSCLLGSIYGFLQGAWPFGLVEAVWSVVAARRWWSARRRR